MELGDRYTWRAGRGEEEDDRAEEEDDLATLLGGALVPSCWELGLNMRDEEAWDKGRLLAVQMGGGVSSLHH